MDTQLFALLAHRAPSAVEMEHPETGGAVDGESSFEGIYSELVGKDGSATSVGSTAAPVGMPATEPDATSPPDAADDEDAVDVVTMPVVPGVSPETEAPAAPAILAAFARIAETVSVEPPDAVVSERSASSEEAPLSEVVPTAGASTTTPMVHAVPASVRNDGVPGDPALPQVPAGAPGDATVVVSTLPAAETPSIETSSAAAAQVLPETATSETLTVGVTSVVPDEMVTTEPETRTETEAPTRAVPMHGETTPAPETADAVPGDERDVPTVVETEEPPVERPAPAGPMSQVDRRPDVPSTPSNTGETTTSAPDADPSTDSQTTEEQSGSEEGRRFTPSSGQLGAAPPVPVEPPPTPSAGVGTVTTDRFIDSRQGEDKGNVEPGVMPERTQGAPSPEATDRPAPAPDVDMTRFVDRVVRFVHTMVGRNESSLEMRLNPPELGSVRLSMELKSGELRMSMVTSTEAARQVISQNLDGLRQTLVQHGFSVQRLDVSVGQHFVDGGTAQSDPEPRHHARGRANGRRTSDDASETRPVYVALTTSRYLDLVA